MKTLLASLIIAAMMSLFGSAAITAAGDVGPDGNGSAYMMAGEVGPDGNG